MHILLNYPYHFNISHSKKYTVVAVSDRPTGVDVEVIRPFSASAAAKHLSEAEKEYIVLDDIPEKRNERFFKLWCAKEAVYKYLSKPGTELKGGIVLNMLGGKTVETVHGLKLHFNKFNNLILTIAEM